MRITFLMPADDMTGGNRVVATYARIMQTLGHEVLVVSNAPDEWSWRSQLKALRNGQWLATREARRPRPGHIAQSGVPHKVLTRPRRITAADVPDADVIVATWWETAVWMHEMPASKGQKVHLIQGYETWTDGEVQRHVHQALKLPNLKVSISAGLKRDIEADLGALNIHVVPNAVDLAQFKAPERQRGPTPTVGFIYATANFKGSDICIEAIRIARQTIPELQVVAFGIESANEHLPLPNGTHHVVRPAQDEIPHLYARCDAWLFGSRIDSFGLPILEAMACRTPVIGVPIGAAPELLADGVGELIQTHSPAQMAQAIVRLCEMTPFDWKHMSDRAHLRAHGYSWQDAVKQFMSLLTAK